MPIETVRRFFCPLCSYMTYSDSIIEVIEKNNGKCPACGNGKSKSYKKPTLRQNPFKKEIKGL